MPIVRLVRFPHFGLASGRTMAHFVVLVSLLSVIHAFDYSRRCLFYRGRCVKACPRHMHPYNMRCDGETMSQRTCDAPEVYVMGYTCGWSRCDCDGDLLLDEQNGECVDIMDCPVYSSKPPNPRKRLTERRRMGRKKYHLSRRVRINEDELTELA